MTTATTPTGSTPTKPSTAARIFGILGLVLMIVPVGFPMYAAIGLVGFSLIWVIFTASWVIMFVLALVWIRRRPWLSFAAPFIASAIYFGLFPLFDVLGVSA